MKTFIRCFLWASGLLLALVALGTGWLYTHEEEIEGLVLQSIAEGLQTDGHITDLQLQWWSSFPQISVALKGVWLKGSSGAQDDMLLRAEEIRLNLDLRQFLAEDFKVEQVQIQDATIALKAERGVWNTSVWSVGAQDPKSESGFSLQLAQCDLQNVDIRIDSESQSRFFITDVQCAFTSAADGGLSVLANGEAQLLSLVDLVFPSPLQMELSVAGEQAPSGDWALEIREWNAEGLLLSGEAHSKGGDWRAEGSFSELGAGFADAVWPEWRDGLRTLSLDHRFAGTVSYETGVFTLNGAAAPADWSWGLMAGRAEARVALTHAKNKWSLLAQDIAVQLPGLSANAALRCADLGQGQWKFDVAPVATVAEIEGLGLLLPSPLDLKNGTISGQITTTLDLPKNKWLQLDAQLSCRNLVATTGDWPLEIESAAVHIKDWQNWTATDIMLHTLGQTFTGAVSTSKGATAVELACDALSIPTDWPDWGDWGRSNEEAPAAFRWTQATLRAERLQWPAFGEGDLAYNNIISLAPADTPAAYDIRWNGNIAGGTAAASGTFDASQTDRWPVQLNCTASGLELQPMFATFRNFGQTTLRAEHLRGQVSWTGDLAFEYDMAAGIVAASAQAEAFLDWNQVRLDNVEALQEIAAYLRDNRLMAPLVDPDDLAQRLRRIDIEQATTHLAIVEGDLQIEPITIASSAMDVDIAGGQTWAGALDYTLGFALRDLKNTREDAFGTLEDDGLGHRFFLTIGGTPDNPEYGWDRAAGKDARKARFEEEKAVLRNIFRRNNASKP